MKGRITSNMPAVAAVGLTLALIALPVTGCVLRPDDNFNFNFNFNGNPNDNDGGPGNENANDNAAAEPPAVTLTANNTQPFEGDQVNLTCSVVPGQSRVGVTYEFQPVSFRLVVNSVAGTAFFIVDQSDVGIELRFTCMGTNAAGTGELSNTVSIFPSTPPFLP